MELFLTHLEYPLDINKILRKKAHKSICDILGHFIETIIVSRNINKMLVKPIRSGIIFIIK